MFIKKDKRKINEILTQSKSSDPTTTAAAAAAIESSSSSVNTVLNLSKRSSEFAGSVKILCSENKIRFFYNLKQLNLYENNLVSIDGIGLLAQTTVEEINLGGNKLSRLPLEFGLIQTLTSVWLDDNELEVFPSCLCQLTNLRCLRMSNNGLSTVPTMISSLEHLETLSLDNNKIKDFPVGCLKMPNLKNLWIRQNILTSLPVNIDEMTGLEVLSISSNRISIMPDSLSNMHSLRALYANGNMIISLPETLCNLASIKEINLSNNIIAFIPRRWKETWGEYDRDTGTLQPVKKDKSSKLLVTTTVALLGNPIIETIMEAAAV